MSEPTQALIGIVLVSCGLGLLVFGLVLTEKEWRRDGSD